MVAREAAIRTVGEAVRVGPAPGDPPDTPCWYDRVVTRDRTAIQTQDATGTGPRRPASLAPKNEEPGTEQER